MKLTKCPQSCFLIETEDQKILIDCGNLVDEATMSNFKEITLLLFTHTHNDHCFLDHVKKIFEKNQPKIFSNQEVAEKLKGFKVEIMKEGETKKLKKTVIEMTKGTHGYWFLMKDKPVPKNNGFIIKDSKTSVYHCGDTLAFYPTYQADLVLVPICGRVVMEPEAAVEFSLAMNAGLTIPMHYENDKHPRGTDKFEKYAREKGLRYKVLKNGESLDF